MNTEYRRLWTLLFAMALAACSSSANIRRPPDMSEEAFKETREVNQVAQDPIHPAPIEPTSWQSLMKLGKGDRGLPFEDARLLLFDVTLDRYWAKRILPFGLFPTNPPKATIFIATYARFPFGVPYHEAAMQIHVRTLFGKGIHYPWIVVDSDIPLISGRDFYGFPKKMAEIEFMEEGDLVRGRVIRHGIEIMTFEAVKRNARTAPEAVFGRKHFNMGVPSFLTFHPLLIFRPREIVRESWDMDLQVALEASVFDPIRKLIAGEPENARLVTIDVETLDYFFCPGFVGGWQWFLNTFNMRYR